MLVYRDFDQLRNAPEYGPTALAGFMSAEEELEKLLRFVPYCDEHLEVWSPQACQIILDSASQVDSIWKAAAHTLNPATLSDQFTIIDHRDTYAPLVANQKVIFFGSAKPTLTQPFVAWQSNQPIRWWRAYNRLKHDRFSNQTCATLGDAVDALGGLLLAIVYSGVCDLALISAQTLDTAKHNPWAFTTTGLLRDVSFEGYSKIETRLFAHPLGVFADESCNLSSWWDSQSPRWNIWWALNHEQFTMRFRSQQNTAP